ncbi:hypothetical protein D3C80_1244880 [compost metagenome]
MKPIFPVTLEGPIINQPPSEHFLTGAGAGFALIFPTLTRVLFEVVHPKGEVTDKVIVSSCVNT